MRDAKPAFIFADGLIAIGAGNVAGAVGCATGACGTQFRLAVGQADDHHSVVHQWQHHRQERGFLSAVGGG